MTFNSQVVIKAVRGLFRDYIQYLNRHNSEKKSVALTVAHRALILPFAADLFYEDNTFI